MTKFILFLLLMTPCIQLAVANAVPIPGDCRTKPYRDTDEDQEAAAVVTNKPDGRLHLECAVSAINSEAERTNFSVIPGEHTASLTVQCQDTVSRSTLEPQGFKSLIWLEELTIKDCNLDTIPDRAFFGLTRLRKLRLYSSSTGLSLSSGSMDGVANLQKLQIPGVSVRVEAPSCLCSLPNLQSLNLDKANLQSLDALGLTDVSQTSCLRSLVELSVAGNQISSLGTSQLQRMPNLHWVDLHGNRIRYLDADLFSFNTDIKVLNLSNNSLRSLPPSLLPLPSLTHLALANNSLTSLPSRFFDNTVNLVDIDLSGNEMTDLKPGLLDNLTSLAHLDLARNLLTKIRKKSFWDLVSLETLSLKENRLEELQDKTFKSQEYLANLDLAGNRIHSLGNETFLGLKELHHLLLNNNQLEAVDNLTFAPLDKLLLLDLSNNRLNKVPGSLSSLQSLDLSYNQISSLAEDSPSLPLPLLWRLNMAGNRLEAVGREVFKEMASLQILDLSNNNIREVETNAFDKSTMLKAIRLDGNRIKGMENLFHSLPNLTWLNISGNRLSEFDYAMLPRSLVWLDLHKNSLESLENYYGVETGIKHLDVGFNRIKVIAPVNIPSSVETVLLNDNAIVEIAPYTFYEKPGLKKVDLTVNNMTGIDRNSIRVSEKTVARPSFLLGGNPVECNCHMLWFRSINAKQSSNNLPSILDLESLYCRLPYSRQLTFAPLVDVAPEQFLCPYQTHCFALCHCCDYDACDCEMACPAKCSCYHDSTWHANIVECSSSNATDLPAKLPMDATELLLDGNNLVKLKSHTFIGRKNLRTLYLNNSNIQILENNTFNGLASLLVLHLHNNRITKFEGDEFQGLVSLRELYLQDNLLTSINNVTFVGLVNLQILHLQGNRLFDYSVWSLSHNQYLLSVGLSENLWTCDCTYMQLFTTWLQTTGSAVLDQHQLRCTTSESTSLDMLNMEFCEEARGLVASAEAGIVNSVLIPVLAASLCLLVLLVLLTVMLLYRNQVKIWLYTRYGIRFFHRVDGSSDQEKIFDALVLYSKEDDMYVQQVLASELELGNNQYRLCLYHRDVGSSHFVADSIIQACDTAKRTILVLSDNLLQQEWSRYDFQTGLLQSIRSLGKKLIVVVLGDIKFGDLEPELRTVVSSATTIHWGEHKFWEKVKFNLPDSGEILGLSQSTTLQSYPSTISYNSSLYQAPDVYAVGPRFEPSSVPASSRPLLSSPSGGGSTPSPPDLGGGLEPVPYSSVCLQSTYMRDPKCAYRDTPSNFRVAPTILREPHYGVQLHRNQNVYTMSTNPRQVDHIYQVCM